MPSLDYPLEKGGPKRLSLIWIGPSISLLLDDQEVAEVSAATEALRQGHQISLPDNSLLSLQLKRGFLVSQLHITRNGVPLPNTASDPYRKIRNAAQATFMLGGLHMLVGFTLSTLDSSMILIAIHGIIFIGLGFAVKKESFLALLTVAIAQLVFNTIPSLINMSTTFGTGGFLTVASFFFRLYLFYLLVVGLGAMWSIRTAPSGKFA